jgi:peroxiredoxin
VAASLAETLIEICEMDAPLWRRIELFVDKQREVGSPFVAATENVVARLRAGDVGETAPKPGEPMPPFCLPAGDGRLVGLDELTREGPVIISFNRGHWCPFCRIELSALAAAHEDLAGLGAQVVSIMPDRQHYIGRLPSAVRQRILLLSDMDSAYALSLGLTMWLDDAMRDLMLRQGVDLLPIQGSSSWVVPVPATFVVGVDGRVLARFVERDFRRRMSVEDIGAALAAGRPASPEGTP